MIVLGIETSCDETGVALYSNERGLLANGLHSQISLHEEFGGVVPELASRDHVARLLPLVSHCLERAQLEPSDISGVAYTAGPGLMGALFVGAMSGRALAYGWGIPAVAVHHMEGHLLAPLLEENSPAFPFLALLVSGGHTQLVKVEGIGRYQILGESLDDAAGEAFDKAAKMLGLNYPGGPAIAKLAEKGRPGVYRFPRPMTDRPGLDFSFSGLKTYCLNTVMQAGGDQIKEQTKADIAYAFQEAVVETLRIKCLRGLKASGCSRLVLAGGVSANKLLRERMSTALEPVGSEVFYPRLEFCTDNGAMIAFAGCQRLLAGHTESLQVKARPRWPMDELTPTQATT